MHGDLQSYDGSVGVVRSLSLREAAQKFNPCTVYNPAAYVQVGARQMGASVGVQYSSICHNATVCILRIKQTLIESTQTEGRYNKQHQTE